MSNLKWIEIKWNQLVIDVSLAYLISCLVNQHKMFFKWVIWRLAMEVFKKFFFKKREEKGRKNDEEQTLREQSVEMT
ncbi:hypothetical protein Scep_028699 [Stephania cephalantha]|uniref:Uncharacterized protein n=1 Tax=Stephania cephalantha TaxID=152367 RepID=A0AAP0EDL9_9MAGN